MLFQKQIEKGSIGNIAYANGSIRFQNINLNVYSYIIDGIAIDAGSHSLRKQFQSFYTEYEIDALYCTHIHEDHTGCAAWFQEKNIPIFLNELSLEQAAKKGNYPLYRKLFWGKRKAFKAAPIPEFFQSRNYEWQSIFAPGHSSDHMVFLNKSTGQLFSGDLFVQVKTKVIMESESIPQIMDSIEKVLSCDFEEVFCNHAGYIKNGKQKLEEKLYYLQEITHRIKHLHQQGKSSKEIHHLLFPRKYPITALSFGQWDSKHIVTSILK